MSTNNHTHTHTRRERERERHPPPPSSPQNCRWGCECSCRTAGRGRTLLLQTRCCRSPTARVSGSACVPSPDRHKRVSCARQPSPAHHPSTHRQGGGTAQHSTYREHVRRPIDGLVVPPSKGAPRAPTCTHISCGMGTCTNTLHSCMEMHARNAQATTDSMGMCRGGWTGANTQRGLTPHR